MIVLKKMFFPALVILSLLLVDAFLLNELQLSDAKKFPDFKTVSLENKTVTQEIFAEKITALVIWTTQAESCFEVLAELDALQKNFPAEVQVVGLVGDVKVDDVEKISAAEKIAKKYSPQILQLAVNDDFYPVLEKVRTVPTTIFIDKQGNLIGQPAGLSAKLISRELDYILQKDSPKFAALKKIHDSILFR